MAKLLTLLTWGFVGVNVLPLFWMVWCSFMGNTEILQGRLLPEPYRNDVALFSPDFHGNHIAATINGEVYLLGADSLNHTLAELDLGAVSVTYQLDGNTLWAVSANKGLHAVDLTTWQVSQEWDWDFFKDSYNELEQTQFFVVEGTEGQYQFARLAKRLNVHPLVPLSVDGPSLSALTGVEFESSSAMAKQLNSILNNPEQLQPVLAEWSKVKEWTNPRVNRLFHKKKRTPRDDRELFRWLLAERFPSELTRFRVVPWEDIWVNRVPGNGSGTSILAMGQRICVGMWWDSYPGLAIIDSVNAPSARWVTVGHGLPSTSIQRLIEINANHILVLHDLGLSMVDVEQGIVRSNYMFGEFGLPYLDGRDVRVVHVDSFQVLMAYGQDGLLFDARSQQVVRMEPEALHGLSSEITSLAVQSNYVWLGLSQGLMRISFEDWANGLSLDRLNIEGNVVNSLRIVGDKLYLGGLQGQVSVLDTTGKILLQSQLPAGKFYFHWRNYQDLWRTIPFGRFLLNSFIICISVVVLCIVLASLASYALARFEFPGRRLLTLSILGTQMVPGVMYLIPIFVVFSVLQKILLIQFVNTYTGIIMVYTAFILPMAIWLLRGFFASLPRELEEAAVIDGCTPFGAFWRITLPAALPGVIATAIYVFLLAWDELMFAWVLSTDISTATIPVGIRMYVGQFGNRFDLLMAAATVATLPVLILFFVMQRQIVSGLTGGSVKN